MKTIDTLHSFEKSILLWFQNSIRNDFLNNIFIFITHLGDIGFIWILLSLILIIRKGTRVLGIKCGVGLLLSLIINNIFIKNIVARIRPFNAIDSLLTLVPHPIDYSFPSGHTAASFIVSVLIFRYLPKKYGISAIVLAILISLSRMYIGVHYPSDVLAGVIIGIIISYLADFIVEKIRYCKK